MDRGLDGSERMRYEKLVDNISYRTELAGLIDCIAYYSMMSLISIQTRVTGKTTYIEYYGR